ncbi:MAG: hypothetical protein CML07_01070 [Psychrobacter sp.]|nr:hypothetical protein [Psychrobacter sp.]
MEYDKYIELFSEASNVNIEDLLEPNLYRRITQAFERNYYNSIKKEFIDKMLSFTHKGDIKNYNFRGLEKQLLRQYLWTGLSLYKKQYDIFHFIFIHNGSQDYYSGNDSDWINAIAMAIYLFNKGHGYESDELLIKNINPVIYESVMACKFFRSKGFNVSIKKGVIKKNNIPTILDYLKILAKRLGEITYKSFIIKLIKPLYNQKSNLYEFNPTITNNSQDNSLNTPYPYGLIYQLSLKYMNVPTIYKKYERINYAYIEFLDFSKKYASLFELQGSSHDFEMMLMRDTDNLLEKITNIVQQDSIYKIEQYVPDDIFDFVEYIASKFEDELSLQELVQNFYNVVKLIRSKYNSNMSTFSKNELDESINEGFLQRFIFNGINKKFNSIDDFDVVDFNEHILVNIDDVYHIVHPQFSVISLYRILYKLIECNMSDSSNLSSLIGDYIEDYLELKMQEKQFNAIYGRSYRVYKLQQNKLNIKSQELECDVLLQSDDYIIFMELKKKELTKISKKGNIFSLLNDLSFSLLDSSYQANKHMRYISEFKEIKFYKVNNDNKPEIVIDLNDRKILKISISSLDYLSLHSKDVFQKFIRLLYNKEIVVSNEHSIEECASIQNFNESNHKLSKELHNEHSKYQLEEVLGFYNSYFLNVFHIIFMINRSDNSEQFIDLLLKSRTFITPYRDFYHELMYRNSISERS